MFWNKEYDFVAIGDIVIDAFIRLEEATVNTKENNHEEGRELCMRFGDKIPYEFVEEVPAVGNAGNAAVAASRLGLKTSLVSNIGNDRNGEVCLASLKKDRVSTNYIKIHRDKKTNYHYVLWFEDDRTILIKHEEYKYKLPDIGAPKWIYLSSLSEHSLSFHDEIIEYFKKNSKTKLVFQPGTFQMKFGLERIKQIYERTDIFFCNKEEAKKIFKAENIDDVSDLLKIICNNGPKIGVVTDGPKGAYAYNGNDTWFVPPYPDSKPPCDRTGAGDAFASTVVAALALGKSIEEALSWGPVNSMSVVQQIGAQKGLLTRPELEDYLKKAPEDYKPRKI